MFGDKGDFTAAILKLYTKERREMERREKGRSHQVVVCWEEFMVRE